MSDTTIMSTLSGAQIVQYGDTFDISGNWTADYSPSGTLDAVSDVNITITGTFTGQGGGTDQEVFTGASIVSNNGTYEIEPIVAVTGQNAAPYNGDGAYDYGSLYNNVDYGSTYAIGGDVTTLAWTGETPTSLDPSSEVAIGATPTNTPLTSDGMITNTELVSSPGSIVDASTLGADASIDYVGPAVEFAKGGVTVSTATPDVLTVTNLVAGDSVTITSSDFPSGATFQYDTTGSALFIGEQLPDGDAYAIKIDLLDTDNNPIPSSDLAYTMASDGSLIVTDTSSSCFYSGTKVRTPAGDVAVETLRAGDLITLSDGRVAPISWLGRQTVSTKFADKMRVLPIRIKADALSASLPARDLLISPDHAVLVDDILVQAGALVNGISILRETKVPETFTYYHVEVADHSLILAENLAAETFVDNVTRMGFDNWDEHEALEGETIPEMDLPRARSARQIPGAIRARLLARGQALYRVDVAEAA